MRLVAEAVVSAGRERVEALKPRAVGPQAEDRAALRVAAECRAAVEKTACCNQRPARPCAISAAERVQDSQSGTRTVTGRAAGEECECQRHACRGKSEELRASLAWQMKPRHVVTTSSVTQL